MTDVWDMVSDDIWNAVEYTPLEDLAVEYRRLLAQLDYLPRWLWWLEPRTFRQYRHVRINLGRLLYWREKLEDSRG